MTCIEPDRNDREVDTAQLTVAVLHSAYDLSARSHTLDAIWIQRDMVLEAKLLLEATLGRLERIAERQRGFNANA